MKKIYLLLAVIVCGWNAAQAQFELTPKGFVDKDNPDKDFVVLAIEGKSKADLFKTTLIYLNKLYQKPSENISYVDGESITVTGIDSETIGSVYNKYSINLEFKDNKIKVNQPSYNLYWYPNGGISQYEVYNYKGKLRREKDKEKLEYFYNGYVAIIKNNAEKNAEDW